MSHILKLITIDGPSASGKSSIGKTLAEKLNWPWVSTGVFYRGLALVCLEKSIFDPKESVPFQEKEAFLKIKVLTKLANDPCWEVKMDREETLVFINGINRTGDIFSEKIALLASDLSRIPQIRETLFKPQRDCFVPKKGLVAEGRDCGTIVFPEAKVKIYLTANEKIRATRRYQQQENKGTHHHHHHKNKGRAKIIGIDATPHDHREEDNLKKILETQKSRDKQDSKRETAPLTTPQGAFVIDSTLLNVDEVIKQILDYAQTQGIY